MKTLYLMRHAKSSWKYPELTDFERPLNDRGRKDLPIMSEVLMKNNAEPDLIVTSPAPRTYFTARNIAQKIDYPIEKILADERIYETGVNDLFNYIKNLSNEHDTVMIFGHNPAFTSLSNYISDKYLENLPTCAYVKMEFNFDKWREIDNETGKVVEYEYPKKYK